MLGNFGNFLQGYTQIGYRAPMPLVAAFAAIMIGIGLWQLVDVARLERTGLRAAGEVVRVDREWVSGTSASNPHFTYHAVVRFRADKHPRIQFRDPVGTNPPRYQPGDVVTVLYDADKPQRRPMIDRGRLWNWGFPSLFVFVGALAGLYLAAMLANRRADADDTPDAIAAVRSPAAASAVGAVMPPAEADFAPSMPLRASPAQAELAFHPFGKRKR